jgi:glutamate synthase (NADPH/NADH) small chain
MEFLPQQNRVVAGEQVQGPDPRDGKHVIVIGGGDTGSTAWARRIASARSRSRSSSFCRSRRSRRTSRSSGRTGRSSSGTSSSHQEGCDRDWAVATKRFEGSNGRVEKLVAVRVEWRKDADGAMKMVEVPGSEFEMKADLVLLAMGFVGPVREGMLAGALRRARSARQRAGGYRGLSDVGAEGLRRGRHAARTIARRPGRSAKAGSARDPSIST